LTGRTKTQTMILSVKSYGSTTKGREPVKSMITFVCPTLGQLTSMAIDYLKDV